jgi:hypothetical protein
MNPKIARSKRGPEAKIQDDLVTMLRNLGWFVKETHGSMFQSGFPDLYATHTRYGARWIEVKLPNMEGSKFTPAQLEDFPKLCANGSGVWVLTAATDSEYKKLFGKFNWWTYVGIMK